VLRRLYLDNQLHNIPTIQASRTKRRDREAEIEYQNMSDRSQWIALAVASGACAAFNGVFAKL